MLEEVLHLWRGNPEREKSQILVQLVPNEPRISDAIADILAMSMDIQVGESLELFVLDFVDAFWNIPLNPRERRF